MGKFIDIDANKLIWAYQRAGVSQTEAYASFPRLREWIDNTSKPTFHQLENFASKFHVPLGYLFLKDIPNEQIPIPMFRGKASQTNLFDLNVYDTIMTLQSRQDWLEEYLVENDIETCPLVNTITLDTPISEAVGILRTTLGIEPRWAFSISNVDNAISFISQKIEDSYIFLSFNGVVGNNTHRKINVSQCRGFVLFSTIAPFIFINSADSKSAQIFTLIHEVTHIMLGKSAGHSGENFTEVDETERYCDCVAASFLVDETLLRSVWKGDIPMLSKQFKVSELVIARRAHDLNMISNEDYKKFWLQYSKRLENIKKTKGGGSFYRTSVKRIGKLFAIHVRNAVNSRQLSYTDAYRMTGLNGTTYQNFMNNSI